MTLGRFPTIFLRRYMKELSIFIDESGDFGTSVFGEDLLGEEYVKGNG